MGLGLGGRVLARAESHVGLQGERGERRGDLPRITGRTGQG